MADKNLSYPRGKERLNANKINSFFNLLILIFIILISGEKIYISSQVLSEISLIIEGNGNPNQPVINDGFYVEPYQVFVNGVEHPECIKTCELPEGRNNIILKFNVQIDLCTMMFYGLNNIKEIDLSNFDASLVQNMNWMFRDCSNLEKIYFGNIVTSSVDDIYGLFQGCSNLTSIDLSNFDFPKVRNMAAMFMGCSNLEQVNFGTSTTPLLECVLTMFQGCTKLKSIDLSNFDFSHVNSFYGMFSGCESLETVNFGNIDTSLVEDMGIMFANCSNLISMDFSNFNLSKVQTMEYTFLRCSNLENVNLGNTMVSSIESIRGLFRGCSKLKSIDLSYFNLSRVKNMEQVFLDCSNIENINFGNKPTSSLEKMSNLFQYCSSLTSINLSYFDTSKVESLECLFGECMKLESLDLSNFNTSQVKNMQYMFISCTSLRYLNLSNFITSKLENIDYMFYGCVFLKYLNLYLFQINPSVSHENSFFDLHSKAIICIHDEETKNLLLSPEQLSFSFCSDECSNLNNSKIDFKNELCASSCLNTSNIYEYNSVCYNKCPNGTLEIDHLCLDNDCNEFECLEGKPVGFYFDLNDEIFKKCFETCKFCYGEGNETINNCIECKQNYKFLNDSENDTNCYENCEFFYYFDKSNAYHCTFNNKCPNGYNRLIPEKNKCEINNNFFSDYIENQLINSTKNNNPSSIEIQDEILKIIQDLLNDEFDTSNIDQGHDSIYTFEKVNYIITSTTNQKNNENYNYSIVDLNECENILKYSYNISNDTSLYMLKIESLINKMRKVEYEVYYPFSKNNLTKLNLSFCEDSKVNILIPTDISSNELDKYNKSSDMYNDLCYTLKTESGTDECLKDRQNEFVNNNLSICEENCEFTQYDNNTKMASCSCYTKIKLPLISDIKVDKDKLFANFKNIKNIANFEMLKCIKLFFDKNNVLKNSSNYMLLILLILSITAIFLFCFYNNKKIKDFIDTNYKNDRIIKKSKTNKFNNNLILNESAKENKKTHSKRDNNNLKVKKRKQKRHSSKNINSHINIVSNNTSKMNSFAKESSQNIDNTLSKSKTLNYAKGKDIKITYNDIELNSLDYEDALKDDNRTYIQYYFSLLRTRHILIFSFLQFRDYNSQAIKIYIFFFTFAINYVVSAMFYSDSTMHKIYVEEGSFNFTYQLPQMFYSLIISSILKFMLNILGIYEKNIIAIKKLKKNDENMKKELFKIKCKIISFFIITYIILILLWIYLGCFCAVYKNTQIHLLLDVSSSFALSFITPLFIYLLPGIFRIPSLRNGGNRPLLFKFSQLLQLL